MKISVLITMRNEASKIKKTIKHIKMQHYSRSEYEIVAIDDGSTDSSVEIARKYGARVINLKKNVWSSEARRFGVNQCRGKIIVFLDAHLYLTNPESFQIIDKILSQNPELGGICGFYKTVDNSDWNQLRDIRREVIFHKQKKGRLV